MNQVNIHHAKTHLSKLLAEVELGGEVVIARDGVAIAKLVAVAALPKLTRTAGALARFGPLPDSFFEPLSEDELAAWEGDQSLARDQDIA